MSTVRNAVDRSCRMDECETPREDVVLVEDPGGNLIHLCGPCRSDQPVEVVDGDLSRFESPAGVEVFDGVKTEYPYRVEDADGQVVFHGFNIAPPDLDAEEIDRVAGCVEAQLRRANQSAYAFRVLKRSLRKLPDGEHGRGALPDDVDEWPGTSRLDLLEGEIDNTIATLRGEADELEARDADLIDEHLRDVIEGLRLRADELEETLDDDQGEA